MSSPPHEIYAKNLTYKHNPNVEASLIDISFDLPKGSRTILVGANGGACVSSELWQNIQERGSIFRDTGHAAGKSTLLQILAGRRLLTQNGTDVRIKDRDVFRQYPGGVTFLGTEWYVPI